MRVLITTDLYLPSVNGVVTSVLSLADGLRQRGHEVRILTLSGSAHAHTDGAVTYLPSFGVERLYPGIRIRTSLCRKIICELVGWHPDVVHSQCEFSTFGIARKVAKICNVPLIHTYHTVYEDYTHYFSPSVRMGRRMAAWFSRQVLNRTDAVIAPTEKVRKLLTSYRIRTPIAVIPTGLESLPQAVPSRQQTDLVRQKTGIPQDRQVLLFLGRLAREKNIPELFGLLDAPGLENAVLVLVGDGPCRAELEQQARQRGLSGRVYFVGMVPHTQVADYYRMAGVFVNASASETQGLTYAEAMSAGLPVVCRADPCVENLIENGKTGFACRNAADMAEAVRQLLSDPALRTAVTRAAADLIASAYTSAAFAAAVEALYIQSRSRCAQQPEAEARERNLIS